MSENIYRTPEADVLAECEFNPMEKIDYHQLREYVSGKRMIYALIVLYALTLLALGGFLVLEIKGQLRPVLLLNILFTGAFFVAVIVGALSSKPWGFWVTIFAAVLSLFVFPLGTIIGAFALRGLYLAKSVYLKPEYNFNRLKLAYAPYK